MIAFVIKVIIKIYPLLVKNVNHHVLLVNITMIIAQLALMIYNLLKIQNVFVRMDIIWTMNIIA